MRADPAVIAEAEGLDRAILEDYVRVQRRVWPDCGAAMHATPAGLAAYDSTGRDSRIAGVTDAASGWVAHLDAMTRWHADRRARSAHPHRHPGCRLVLAPDSSAALPGHLADLGYRPTFRTPVLGRDLAAADPHPVPADITVVEAGPDDRGATVALVARAYFDGHPPDALDLRAAATWFDLPGATHFIALRDGEPAGAAAIVLRPPSALLGQMAVLPRHRRRGVQRALLHARIEHARHRSAHRAYLTTAPDSPSQRNAERAGFTRLYSRLSLAR